MNNIRYNNTLVLIYLIYNINYIIFYIKKYKSKKELDIHMKDQKHMVKEINKVWGDYDDFKNLGIEYYEFIIQQDLKDMRDSRYNEEECADEISDCIINSLRMLDELGYDPTQKVFGRLENHNNRDLDNLVDKKVSEFEKNK